MSINLSINTIKAINKGDIIAFKHLYENMFKSLSLFAYKIYPDQDIIADIVQEAFIVIWNKRKELNSLPGVKSYLYAVVKNNTIRKLREDNRNLNEDQIVDNADLGEFVNLEETYKLVDNAVESLAEKSRKIVRMTMNGYTNAEIANRTNTTVNTIKTLKKRAYIKLREQLKDNFFVLILFDLLNE